MSDTATIKLRGKYAVGQHSHAIVDADMFDELNQYAWKAKPNGSFNNVYAVRNAKTEDGRLITIRMHRVVLGYVGPLDIDHINHNSLDNRRDNLRIATRSENGLNRREIDVSCSCRECGKAWQQVMKAGTPRPAYCSTQCATAKAKLERKNATIKRWHRQCQWCGTAFDATAGHQRYCTESCRKSAKWRRQSEAGKKPPSATRGAIYARQRRKLIKDGLWKILGSPVSKSGAGSSDPVFSLVTTCLLGG